MSENTGVEETNYNQIPLTTGAVCITVIPRINIIVI